MWNRRYHCYRGLLRVEAINICIRHLAMERIPSNVEGIPKIILLLST